MSNEWAIMPPNSPVVRRQKNDDSPEKFPLILDDWNVRMFCCMGEPQYPSVTFHEESYLRKNDIDIFKEEHRYSPMFVADFGSQVLFNRKVDKGSALVLNMGSLFNMAKYSFIQLDSAAKLNVKIFGTKIVSKKMIAFVKCRKDIVNFLLYVRNYIQRICACSKYKWMANSFLPKLNEELNSFRLLCGTTNRLPNCVINHSTNNAGNECSQPSYHLFHCHLDIKWLHVTLMYQLMMHKRQFKNDTEENVRFGSVELFENYVQHLISDLIIIVLKRFEYIAYEDLLSKSPFVCTCVRELWKLLQLCTDLLHSKGLIKAFWSYVNEACDKISVIETSNQNVTNGSELSLPQCYTCSNPSLFIIWFLKHLAMLYTYKLDKLEETKSNYQLLENIIKTCISAEIAESQMRVFLQIMEFWLNIDWEMKTEPLVLLWEYFHKKLNSLFFVPSVPIDGLAVVSTNAGGLINQLNNVLDSNVTEKNLDSYHLFLRLLGRSLRKWHNSHFWNQLKGRIFSKFSLAKLLSLNETGLYHFIALFLTLALTSDLFETSMKMQSLLIMLPINQLDNVRLKLIWKAHIALILLFAKREHNLSSVSNSLLDAVNSVVVRPNNLDLMRIFSDGFQDLMDSTNNLELGQYIFIGKWIPIYLSKCSESDASRFLDSLLTLMNNLNSISSLQLPLGQDSQLLLIYNNLSEHLVPYLKRESINPSSLHHISDLAATLTSMSVKTCFSSIVNSEAKDLFKFLLTQETTDTGLLCRYLSQISCYEHLRPMLKLNSILLIKGWLRCLILFSYNDTRNEDLYSLTNYIVTIPELEELFSETSVMITSNLNHFENFLMALQLKYQSGNQTNDPHLRNKLISQVGSYFSIDRWLSYMMKDVKVIAMASNIYYNLGQVVLKIPQLLYVRSKPNTLLQKFIDTLLLPNAIRQTHFKLSTRLCEAIKSSFYLYICGLFKLEPENDPFILRTIKELLSVYVPRLVTSKGSIHAQSRSPFSLMKCFEFSENFEFISKTIITTICSSFIRPRMKTQFPSAFQALIFFNDLIRLYKHNDQVVKCFIENALERVCDVIMFSEEVQMKKEAKDILHFIVEMRLIRDNANLGNNLMNVFSIISRENLAFNSRSLFDLFEDLIPLAPDLVLRFIPQLEEKIEEVETKRGVGYDRSLRKGIEHIKEALLRVKNDQKSKFASVNIGINLTGY